MATHALHGKWFCKRFLALGIMVFSTAKVQAQAQQDTIPGFIFLIRYANDSTLLLQVKHAERSVTHLHNAAKEVIGKVATRPKGQSVFPFAKAFTETNALPKEFSTQASNIAMKADLKLFGVVSHLNVSELRTGFDKQLTDFTIKLNPTQALKDMAKQVQTGYAGVTNDLIRNELTDLKKLRTALEKRVRIQLDSIHQYANRMGFPGGAVMAQLNYESFASGSAGKALLMMQEWVNNLPPTPNNGVRERYEQQLRDISRLMQAIRTTGLETLIQKYEELVGVADHTLIAQPGKLKNFIRRNRLPVKFNPLFFLKELDMGNLFRSANFQRGGAELNAGTVQQGVQILLNNKSALSIFAGRDITADFDKLWLPNDAIATIGGLQASAGKGLNTSIGVKQIESLGGIGVEAKRSISQANPNNSFFGSDRVFQSLRLEKTLVYRNSKLLIAASTSFSSYNNGSSNNKNLPLLSGGVQSYDVVFAYQGSFYDRRFLLDIYLRGTSGNGISQLGNYKRPNMDADVKLNRRFRNKSQLLMQFGKRSFQMSAGSAFNTQRFLTSIRIPVNRKNLLEMKVAADVSEYTGQIYTPWFNRSIASEFGHQLNLKKRAIRYQIFSKAVIRHVKSNTVLQNGSGWAGEFYSSLGVTFPSKITLLQSITYSGNSFSNNIFLTGNRLTVEPGINITKKKFSYTTNLIYESVDGFYEQCGIRFSLTALNLFNRFSLNLSTDARYTLKEQVKVFNAPVMSYGNAGLQYTLK